MGPIVDWCAAQDAAAHLFVDRLDERCVVEGPHGHHLQRVRRLRRGEAVTAADGSGAWRSYDVAHVAPGRLDLVATSPVCTEPALSPRVTIAIALTKGGLDQIVARCTELGVDRVVPVRTRRSVVKWDDTRAEVAVAKLRVVAREAAAQSRRARVPEIAPVAAIAELVGSPGLLVADRSGVPACTLPAPGDEGWTVLVGPEGGFAADDLDPFGGSVPRLAVGPYVLRADTAPVAAVAALRALADLPKPATDV